VKSLISGEVDGKGLAKYKEAPLEVENDHLVSSVVGKATKAMGLDGSKEWILTTSEGIPLLSGGDMKSAKDMGVYYLAATGMSLAEVEPHRVNKDCWVVIDVSSVFDASDFGHFVYDVSAYINDHPGGKEIVLKQSGGLVGCKEGLFIALPFFPLPLFLFIRPCPLPSRQPPCCFTLHPTLVHPPAPWMHREGFH